MAWWHCVDKVDGTKEVWVSTARWYDARAVGRRETAREVTVTQAPIAPHARAYAKGLVFRAKWIGHAAGKHSTLELITEKLTTKDRDRVRRA